MIVRSSMLAATALALLMSGCDAPSESGDRGGPPPLSLADFLSEALDGAGTIGEIAGDGPAVLGQVRMVRAVDAETVLVLDRYEPFLRRFVRTEDGRWRLDRTAVRTGQGPGEARDVTTFHVDSAGTTYLLHDLFRITAFDSGLAPTGAMYRAGFPVWAVAEAGEDRILVLGPERTSGEQTVTWARVVDLRSGDTVNEFQDPMPPAARRVPALHAAARDPEGRPGVLHFGTGGPAFLSYESEAGSIVAHPLLALKPVASFQPLATDPGAPPGTPDSHRRFRHFSGMLWMSGDQHLWTEETVAAPLEDPTAITRPTIITGHREGEWRRLVLPNPYSVHMGAGPDQAFVYTDEPYPRIAVVSAEALFAAFWASAEPLETEGTPDPGEVEFGSGAVSPARSDGS